ncbi:MAG: purine-binding chemotaxis protein CheW [Oscillospiraceae bacterium]|nr:purine-binding chemotaxis protein CheW [Oscillospiraceae bacterium]
MEDGKYLTFELSGQMYAIDIRCIREILNGHGSISPVPEFPEYSLGVINLRGDIVPIIDMRKRFHKPPIEGSHKECIIVTESSNSGADYIGFSVDKVSSVMDFEGKDISAAPKLTSNGSKYVTGMYKADGRIIIILDTDLLLTDSMVEAIGEYMGNLGLNSDE